METRTAQNELLLTMQKKNREQAQKIKGLEEDVVFLKKALAIALKDAGTINMAQECANPQFSLDENIGGEMIIRLIHF